VLEDHAQVFATTPLLENHVTNERFSRQRRVRNTTFSSCGRQVEVVDQLQREQVGGQRPAADA